MIKIYYEKKCLLVKTLCAIRPIYGRRSDPLVAKFETNGKLVNNKPTPVVGGTADRLRTTLWSMEVCRRTPQFCSSDCLVWLSLTEVT